MQRHFRTECRAVISKAELFEQPLSYTPHLTAATAWLKPPKTMVRLPTALACSACFALLAQCGAGHVARQKPCEGLHGSDNVTCVWGEAVQACLVEHCKTCAGNQCARCQHQPATVFSCCAANSHSSEAEPPQLCKEALLAQEIKDCISAQCAGCSGEECTACEHQTSVVSSCCEGDFLSAMAPRQCRNVTSASPCAGLDGPAGLSCAWAEDVRSCVESGCKACSGCSQCRDSSRVSTCCDEHYHHPAAPPTICQEAVLTEAVKSCVVTSCDGCVGDLCQRCRADLVKIAACCVAENYTGHPPPYCDEALKSTAATGTQMPILP